MKIKSCFVAEGPLFEINTEDGPAHVCNYIIVAVDLNGDDWEFLTRFSYQDRHEAQHLAKLVDAAGRIHPVHWVKVPESPSTEERAYDEFMREVLEEGRRLW